MIVAIVKRSNAFSPEVFECTDMKEARAVFDDIHALTVGQGASVTCRDDDYAVYRSQHGNTWSFAIATDLAA